MRFENQLHVRGRLADVLEVFADVPLLASLLPGACAGPADAEGMHEGTLEVAFGPKRLTFRGRMRNALDRASASGVLNGSASGDIRNARMAVEMHYRLTQDTSADGPVTKITLDSEAQLAGVLADFAQAGGVAVTRSLLAEFERRLGAHLAQASWAPGTSAPAPDKPEALSAWQLIKGVLLHQLRSALGALAGRRS